jgi:hypothetical protein
MSCFATDLQVYLHRARQAMSPPWKAGAPVASAALAPPACPYLWHRQRAALSASPCWGVACADPGGWYLPLTAAFEGLVWRGGGRPWELPGGRLA